MTAHVVGHLAQLGGLLLRDARGVEGEVDFHLVLLLCDRLFHDGGRLFGYGHGSRRRGLLYGLAHDGLLFHHGLRLLHHGFLLDDGQDRLLGSDGALRGLAQGNLHTHEQVALPVGIGAALRVPLVGQHIHVGLQTKCHALRQSVLHTQATAHGGAVVGAVPHLREFYGMTGGQHVRVVVVEGNIQSSAQEGVGVPPAAGIVAAEGIAKRQRSVQAGLHVLPLVFLSRRHLPVAPLPARRAEAQTEQRRELTSHAQLGGRRQQLTQRGLARRPTDASLRLHIPVGLERLLLLLLCLCWRGPHEGQRQRQHRYESYSFHFTTTFLPLIIYSPFTG